MNKYIVAMIHNFDSETRFVEFDDYNTAKAYLHWLWEVYYNEELENESDLDEDSCYHKEDYAIVKWVDGDCTEFILNETSEPFEEFNDVDINQYL